MTHRMRLKLASLAFGFLWTAWMMWWSAPVQPAEFVILALGGVMVGLAWYWLYGRWYRWHFARKVFPHKPTS